MSEEMKELSEQECWNVLEYYNSMYNQLKGISASEFYNTNHENRLLVDLNNNPQIPTQDSLRDSIANYKENADLLREYSQFMEMWDGIYKKAIDYKLNLLSFDINKYCINAKENSDYASKEYKDDVRRVNKFFQNFGAKQEFRDVVKNMLLSDTYFTWLRDSDGSFDEEAISLENESGFVEKKNNSFILQMMPQKYCKITGEFTAKNLKGKGFLWDFDLNYFNNSRVNILNFDPSLVRAFNSEKENGRLRSFVIDNTTQLNKQNTYNGSTYIRTKVNNGAWVWKFDTSNFNAVPPFAYLLKSVFNDDIIERLQKDKDIISANAIILGEMKTREKENVGNNANPFTIEPRTLGTLMNLARKGINKNIKQIALPLEETRLYQFADNNSNMYKNTLATNAGLSAHNASVVFSTDKMTQEEAQIASTIDYYSIANSVYPQIENFLNFFVNKKTKKYKFRFKVSGSTLPFIRDKEIENHMKFSDKGIQVPIGRIGTLLGYEDYEFEAMVKEAKYGNMQEDLFLLMNANTTKDGSQESTGGAPKKEVSDLADGGATSREYQ